MLKILLLVICYIFLNFDEFTKYNTDMLVNLNNNNEEYKHFINGENNVCFPNEKFIIHLDEPRCFIRYEFSEELLTDYDLYLRSINVQWIDGKPHGEEQISILKKSWNFLVLEDEFIMEDLEEMKNMMLESLAEEDLDLENYKSGHFFLNPNEDLEKVCNAPKKGKGVFII